MSEHKKFELNPSVAILIAGVIIAGAIVFTNTRAPAAAAGGAPAGDTITAASIRPPSAKDHIVGNPNAPIVLIEYSDFQCPYCQMIHSTLKKVAEESNGQIAWAYRQFPLTSIHPQAAPAANASECIAAQLGNVGFWKYVDTIFANQKMLSPEYSASVAGQLGVNMQAYTQCVAASTYQNVIDADTSEAQGAGGTGTPFTVVVNTKNGKAAPISGALPYAQVMAVIKSVQ